MFEQYVSPSALIGDAVSLFDQYSAIFSFSFVRSNVYLVMTGRNFRSRVNDYTSKHMLRSFDGVTQTDKIR